MKAKKIFAISVLSIFLIGIISYIGGVSAAGGQQGQPTDVSGQKQGGAINAGEAKSYKFQNGFQFQLQVNASMNFDVECDEAVGAKGFNLQLNTSNAANDTALKVQIQANNSAMGLTNGSQIQARNQNRYRYQNMMMMNLTYNGTGPIQAKLEANCSTKDDTWAFYNETSNQWEIVPSEYKDGVLTADTDHFSLWTILTPEASTTTTPTTGSTVDGYSILGILGALGVVSAILIKRRH
jgi:hypothetical protein